MWRAKVRNTRVLTGTMGVKYVPRINANFMRSTKMVMPQQVRTTRGSGRYVRLKHQTIRYRGRFLPAISHLPFALNRSSATWLFYV